MGGDDRCEHCLELQSANLQDYERRATADCDNFTIAMVNIHSGVSSSWIDTIDIKRGSFRVFGDKRGIGIGAGPASFNRPRSALSWRKRATSRQRGFSAAIGDGFGSSRAAIVDKGTTSGGSFEILGAPARALWLERGIARQFDHALE
jgi:hypothetical protein